MDVVSRQEISILKDPADENKNNNQQIQDGITDEVF
jgi:hypothetical protein